MFSASGAWAYPRRDKWHIYLPYIDIHNPQKVTCRQSSRQDVWVQMGFLENFQRNSSLEINVYFIEFRQFMIRVHLENNWQGKLY